MEWHSQPWVNPELLPEPAACDQTPECALEVREFAWRDTLRKVTQYRPGRRVRVGDSAGCDHFLPAFPGPGSPALLVHWSGRTPVLRLAPGFDGIVQRGDRCESIPELLEGCASGASSRTPTTRPVLDLPLSSGDQALVAFGPVALLLRPVVPERLALPPVWCAVSPLLSVSMVACLLGAVALLLSARYSGPYPAGTWEPDLEDPVISRILLLPGHLQREAAGHTPASLCRPALDAGRRIRTEKRDGAPGAPGSARTTPGCSSP